jgi:glycosyltransferase involved in cell wall biosynthesis
MSTVLLLEPFNTGSHAAWLRGLQRFSRHTIQALTLHGSFWQWRMQGGAVTLARQFNQSACAPDLIVASDMLDLTTFLALTRRRTAHLPSAVYFHENQLTYPAGERVKRDLKIAFINYASALAADAVFFNSAFHLREFLDELPRLLKHYPDYNELETVSQIAAKAHVLPVGIDFAAYDAYATPKTRSVPTLLWNHRWEYDKRPEVFARALEKLMALGVEFRVILAGEPIGHTQHVFAPLRERLGSRLLHYGYAERFEDYARLLWQATHAVSCAVQDFFGVSMAEAIYCGALPIMPRRLNYPALVPSVYHDLCLYNEGELVAALLRTLHTPAPEALRAYIAQFDWRTLIAAYDQAFDALIQGAPPR